MKLNFILLIFLCLAVNGFASSSHGKKRQRQRHRCHPISREHTTAAPTTTTTPKPQPVLSVCNATSDINSSTGTYLKSACYVNVPTSTVDAALFCTRNNMALFTLTDTDTFNSLKNFLFTLNSGFVIYDMNGYQKNATVSNTWTLYTDQTVPFYNTTFGNPFSANAERCAGLLVSGSGKTAQFNAIACTTATSLGMNQYFVCEYNKN